jgi:hypothetical protein
VDAQGGHAPSPFVSSQFTRRRLLVRGGIATAGVLGAGGWVLDRALTDSSAAPVPPASTSALAESGRSGGQRYVSRPDLRPPPIEVQRVAPDIHDGLIFVAPWAGPGDYGPMIVDRQGELVYFHPLGKDEAANFRIQQYLGKPVLTWWEGHVTPAGHGIGEYVIADDSYRELARLKPVNGLAGDFHEFLITPENTALFTIFHTLTADLSSLGASSKGQATESIVQEIDINSGKLLMQWNSIDHVEVGESYEPFGEPYDYMHANSVDIDHDGNLLISARNTWTVYKVDRHSGEVIWRLGGKRSDFAVQTSARFLWQHDFRRHTGQLATVFDNGSSGVGGPTEPRSRGLMLSVDETRRTVTLVREYVRGENTLASSQGNVQVLPDGDVFVGWGSEPYLSEFRGAGQPNYEAMLPAAGQSYRAFRNEFTGTPRVAPAVAVRRHSDGLYVYASWNGSTEVATWQVLAGAHPARLTAIAHAPRQGFETVIKLHSDASLFAVAAQDSRGRGLGRSAAVSA